MDAVSIPPQLHLLNDKWNMYYHLPTNKSWDLASYTVLMDNINSVENVIELNNKINDYVVRNCMLFVMRAGITPMWEDPKNRNGGCFSYKVGNKFVVDVWKKLFCLMCGDTLCVNSKNNKHVNGITISPKKNFCIIKIWLNISTLQDPNEIVNIQNLSVNGCLFKKHEPEF